MSKTVFVVSAAKREKGVSFGHRPRSEMVGREGGRSEMVGREGGHALAPGTQAVLPFPLPHIANPHACTCAYVPRFAIIV